MTAKADGGAAVPVADVENTLLLAWGARERPPREVTIRVATKAAPRPSRRRGACSRSPVPTGFDSSRSTRARSRRRCWSSR